jgi:hypothetical protein
MPMEKPCPFDARLYLLSHEFPFFRDNVSVQEFASGERFPGKDLQTDEIWSAWKALLNEADEAVVSKCIEVRFKALEEQIFEREREQYCVSHDHRAFEANYARWATKPYIRASECAWLLLGLDPSLMVRSMESPKGLPLLKDFQFLRDSCERAQECSMVDPYPDLHKWVEWARSIGQPVPPELEHVLEKQPAPNNLRLENEQLKKKIELLDKEGLHPKERTKLTTILLALAQHHHNHRPDAARSSAAREIAETCHRFGYTMDEGTVLKYLRQGYNSAEGTTSG